MTSMSNFNLNDYETVAQRVARFRVKYPQGRLINRILDQDEEKGTVLAECSVYLNQDDKYPTATDIAHGVQSLYPRHLAKFYVEDTCTSACGRALGLVLEVVQKPTREDMQKVQSAEYQRTSSENINVENPSDPWTVTERPQAQHVSETIEVAVNTALQPMLEYCDHGNMIWKTGTAKSGKLWGAYRCPSAVMGDITRCPKGQDVIWYGLFEGVWKKQEK